MAKTTKVKPATTATPAAPSAFEVTIKIEAAYASMSKGIVYPAQTVTIIADAKDEVTATNKALRSFGLFHRNDVKFSTTVKASKAPRVAAYNPSK